MARRSSRYTRTCYFPRHFKQRQVDEVQQVGGAAFGALEVVGFVDVFADVTHDFVEVDVAVGERDVVGVDRGVRFGTVGFAAAAFNDESGEQAVIFADGVGVESSFVLRGGGEDQSQVFLERPHGTFLRLGDVARIAGVEDIDLATGDVRQRSQHIPRDADIADDRLGRSSANRSCGGTKK